MRPYLLGANLGVFDKSERVRDLKFRTPRNRRILYPLNPASRQAGMRPYLLRANLGVFDKSERVRDLKFRTPRNRRILYPLNPA